MDEYEKKLNEMIRVANMSPEGQQAYLENLRLQKGKAEPQSDLMSTSTTTKQAFIPNQFQEALMQAYQPSEQEKALRERLLERQGAATQQMQDFIQQREQAPQQINVAPAMQMLAAYDPTWSGMAQYAAANQPQSADQRAKEIAKLKQGLTGMELGSLQEMLKSEQSQRMQQANMLTRLAQMQSQTESKGFGKQIALANLDQKVRGQNRLEREEVNKKIEKFNEKRINALEDMSKAFDTIEQVAGFDIDDIDPVTGKVNGKEVDAPGITVPGVGRVYEPGSKGETIYAAFSNIFNRELKDRSGAAVTDPELRRLQSEYAAGAFSTETQMLAAIKRYKDILIRKAKQHEAAYKPFVPEMRKRGMELTDSLFPAKGYNARNKPKDIKPPGVGSGPGGTMSFEEWKASKGQ